MDATATTSSPSSAVVIPKPATRRTIQWPDAPAAYQNFSLPSSIVYYMGKNPSSPSVYNKLIKSGKYFFEVNPILVVADMYGHELHICSNEECIGRGPCCINIDINKCTSKFWFTHGLYFNWNKYKDFASLLRPMAYRSDIDVIRMFGKHVVFDDFKFLASSAVEACLNFLEMSDNDGKAVSVEDIIEAMPKVKKFEYQFWKKSPATTPSTIKNIVKLLKPEHLEYFRLNDAPSEGFNVDDLASFISDYKSTKIYLEFSRSISAEYSAQLETLIDGIIASNAINRMICFDGQDAEKFEIMDERYDYGGDDL